MPLINLSAASEEGKIITLDPDTLITEATIGVKDSTEGVEGEAGKGEKKKKETEIDPAASALKLLDELDDTASPFVQLAVSTEEVLEVEKSKGIILARRIKRRVMSRILGVKLVWPLI